MNNNYELKWGNLDDEKIKKILVENHDFNEERINSVLEKFYSETKPKTQKGLGDYF